MGKGTQPVKHIDKSTPEPEDLKSYRIKSPTSTWDAFKCESPDCYRTLRRKLREDQSGLCAYCELSLDEDNEQIAHFHPKSDTAGQQNWALAWDNMWMACKGGSQTWKSNSDDYLPPLPENLSCDERKGCKIIDGSVVTPNEVPVFPRIFRYEQHLDRIEIWPDENNCEQIGLEPERVQYTIDTFNLNCPRLAKARLRVHRQLEQAVKTLRESGYQDIRKGLLLLAQRHLRKNDENRWPAFFTLIRWRFRSFAEDHLQAIGYRG